MKIIILAAGYATRLYPLTINFPKCLLTVGGKTILDTLCDKFSTLPDVEEIIIVTNAKFSEALMNWKQKTKISIPVTVLNDETTSNETRLGAIGDFSLCLKKFGSQSDVLLVASDNLFEEGFDGFYQFCKKHPTDVTVALYDIKDARLAAKRLGVLEIDQKTQEVTNIEEKPESPRSSLIGMGVYFFPATTLPLVTDYLSQKDPPDAPGFYVRWLLGRVKIYGYLFSGLWFDIGTIEALDEANRLYPHKK